MSKRLSLREPSGANPAWLAVPLVVFALITLTVGLVARQTVREPYATPFFHPFLTDTLEMKAWLVTVIHSLLGSALYGAATTFRRRSSSGSSLNQCSSATATASAVVSNP